jgi:AcrR family transcriptional regulator
MVSTSPLRARLKETVAGAILDAAEQLAAEVGLPAASLQGVAQRAGVAVGTIYNYFDDRDELFAEVFARRRAELLAALDAAAREARGSGSFDTQVRAFVRAVFTFFDARRSFLRIALDGHGGKALVPRRDESGQTSMEQVAARAERVIRVGLKENRLKAEGADLFAFFLVAAIRALLMARINSPGPFVDDTERVIALFLHGTGR